MQVMIFTRVTRLRRQVSPSLGLTISLFVCLVANAHVSQTPLMRPAGIAAAEEPHVVAGYRALFTCSAYFHAQRTLEQIRAIELVDVESFGYPAPVIDQQRRLVTATTPDGEITMIAAYRASMGCTLLPAHWDIGDVPRLPYIEYPPAPDLRRSAFPAGDAVRLPRGGIAHRFRELKPVIERAFDGASFNDVAGGVTAAVLVVDDGTLVVERYAQGFGIHRGYRTWSTAKSISAALIGIAAAKGVLDIAATADIPEWRFPGDPRAAITYKDLLWMSSGLYSGGNNTRAVYFAGQDAISAITSAPLEVAPGTRWKYANNDTLLALRGLRYQLNDDLKYLRFPYDELLHRIGMYHTRMETDYDGNFIGSSQVYTTARDLARFGVLLANRGVWQGERILPAEWIDFVTTPAPTRPPVTGEHGYGAQFWLLDQYEGIPEGTYTTAGNKGQYVTIVPEQKLVIVRTGVNPDGVRWQQQQFVAELVAALQRKSR